MFFGLLKIIFYLVTFPLRFLGTLVRFAAFLAIPIMMVKTVKMMKMKHQHHHHHEE